MEMKTMEMKKWHGRDEEDVVVENETRTRNKLPNASGREE
jgi:hypothetical protein